MPEQWVLLELGTSGWVGSWVLLGAAGTPPLSSSSDTEKEGKSVVQGL